MSDHSRRIRTSFTKTLNHWFFLILYMYLRENKRTNKQKTQLKYLQNSECSKNYLISSNFVSETGVKFKLATNIYTWQFRRTAF